MHYWLMKTEPSAYSWDDLVRDGNTVWEGIRSSEARNNMRIMQPGDPVLIYHSVEQRMIVGLAEISHSAYPDPTADDPKWLAVEVKPIRPAPKPLSLAAIKADPTFAELDLIRKSRLSIAPIKPEHWTRLITLLELEATT